MIGDGSWTFVLIVVAAAIVSDAWRFLGAVVATRIDEGSLVFRLVKAVATTLIAAVVIRLTLYPTGILAETPVLLRLGSLVVGLGLYLATGRSVAIGLAGAIAVLVVGAWLLPR
ncbi:MAG: AzlD domain-containing protein [Labrys sp. (in: a-proteobacteria)]|jgi:hypothetical protein